MNNQIQVFKGEFGEIRTVVVNGEPWFVGKDVCMSLGYSNPRKAVIDHVDPEDKGVTNCDTPGGNQQLTIINESGMYALIFGSKLESARKFKKWVTSDVLPQIRKTGSYKKPLTALEKLELQSQALLEVNTKVDDVKQELEDFRNDLPLLAVEIDRITVAKNQKIVPLLGGKQSPAYKDKSLRTKVYRDMEAQLWRQFGVRTYKAIKRCQVDTALDIINGYELPLILKDEVEDVNSQLMMSL